MINRFALLKELKSLKNDTEKVAFISKITDQKIKELAIGSIQDPIIKLQQAKNLSRESARTRIYSQVFEEDGVLEYIFNEIDNMTEPFFSINALAKLPNSPAYFSKKLNYLVGLIFRKKCDELCIKTISFSLQELYRFKLTQKKGYSYEDFLQLINGDYNRIAALSLLGISIDKRNQLASSIIENSELRSQLALLYLSKEELMNKYNSEEIETLGLPEDMTIGIELEAEGLMSIAFNGIRFFNRWEAKDDDSLENGVEVVPPPLRNTKADMCELHLVCNIMRDCGLKTTERCGGHIHLGADYLDTKEAFENFWLLYLANEQIIYQLCNASGEEFRNGVTTYAKPVSPLYESSKAEIIEKLKKCQTRDEIVNLIKNFQKGHRNGLNTDHIDSENKNTIEFRMSNCTLNFIELQNNIRLYGRLFQRSKEVSIIQKKFNSGIEITQEEMLKLQMFQRLCEQELADDERAMLLIDFLFEEHERDIYIRRYKQSKIGPMKKLFGKSAYRDFYISLKASDKKASIIPEEIERGTLGGGDNDGRTD